MAELWFDQKKEWADLSKIYGPDIPKDVSLEREWYVAKEKNRIYKILEGKAGQDREKERVFQETNAKERFDLKVREEDRERERQRQQERKIEKEDKGREDFFKAGSRGDDLSDDIKKQVQERKRKREREKDRGRSR